ncbi:hypothetical protein G6O69_28400 [Pseudenhygromyxa sp. WMMC2535]|uniref:hypothetical protein n=1 Tax=Pseudenhygromyxa sp. WMMC2535 TaxID=2712867 RepID=UPI001554098E|nr:hypothetical protein [Pseudenhygromyxa sp. WMMC2535]NVB41788.1 hypothetical protein [Pseudenhygromyxa sp. WMMC2535]
MRLPEPGSRPAGLLAPALAAAAWWAVLASVADEPLATQRSMVFIGGPLLLLSGIHARSFTFLHAPERLRLLPLPIAAQAHWATARRSHAWALACSLVLGGLAVIAANPRENWSLLGEFACLGVIAWLLEPALAAAAAHFGRRFPQDSRAGELQRSFGGGWTTPEAVVHLYAPALGIGAATALAMPAQLSLERWVDRGGLETNHVLLALAPLALALGIRAIARPIYCGGMWEAIPWLAEASRTVAGPPQPEPTPRWLERLPDPWLRLQVAQFLRLTPLPALRLAAVAACALIIGLREADPSGPAWATALALCGLWLAPAQRVRGDRAARARMAGALPLAPSRRQGRAGAAATLLLWLPAALLLAATFCRQLLARAS